MKRSITITTYGATITTAYDDSKEIRKRISVTKNVVIALSHTWKNKSISLKTKKRLLNTLVFLVAAYCSECWVVKQSDRKRLASLELWSYRRLFRVSWTEHRTNDSILEQLNIKITDRLLNCIERRKLAFYGHVVRRDGLGKDFITGMVFGKRKRGRPKTRYKDDIKELTNLSMMQLYRMALDRREWRKFIMDSIANHSNDLSI